MRGNILKEIKDVSLEEHRDDGTESIIDISISPDALVDKTAGNQIPPDVIYLDEHSGIPSFGQPGAQSLIRWCGLILEQGYLWPESGSGTEPRNHNQKEVGFM